MVIAADSDPRPRRMDLMIAAIGSALDLPLYTRDVQDFKGSDNALTVIAI
jgi:toxin FitB